MQLSYLPRQIVAIFFTPLFCLFSNVYCQSRLNYGLDKPQAENTLPRSRGNYVAPTLKSKLRVKTMLMQVADGSYNISGGWDLTCGDSIKQNGHYLSQTAYKTDKWYNAVVPGTVLTSLVKAGVYPDPYFGLNNLHIPDALCRQDWWYRTVFTIPGGTQNKLAFLNFDGINYAAEIWFNGQFVGKIKGAFKQGEFNVTSLINRTGINVLAVHILPPPDPGIPHEESVSAGTGPNGGKLCFDGPTFICTEGWDWIPGIRDRDMGIWENVSLKFTGAVTIADTRVDSELPLPDTSKANLTIQSTVRNNTSSKQLAKVRAEIGGIFFEQNVLLKPYEKKNVSFLPSKFKQLHLNHPRLWWPNGYGNPELYHLAITAITADGTQSDCQITCFGIRELSYEMTVDFPDHPRKRVEYRPLTSLPSRKSLFDNITRENAGQNVAIARLKAGVDTCLMKNCSDSTTAPYLVIKVNGKRIYCKGGNWGMDDAMKNISREHLEPYIRLHRDAHFNMIRNWTGESTEQTFYDLCDKYGILVWNDFWLSTEGYNLNVKDDSLFLNNARDVIRRFRNHPSIAIWCARNEGYAPPAIEDGLASIVAIYDGTRYYQPNSRLMNLRTSGPWNYFTHPGDYEKIASGFSTELGSPSVPIASSMRKMMSKEDLWPIGDVWYYHDFHDGQKAYITMMDSLYGKALDLDDFCRKAQMLNYESYRAMFEGWQSHLWNNTTGLLLWMSHPAWPSTDWQTYSWDYETSGSYFGSMKACEPVHIQMSLNDNRVKVINNSLHSIKNARIQETIFSTAGKKIRSFTERTTIITASTVTDLGHTDFLNGLSGVYLVRLQILDHTGHLISCNDYWRMLGKADNFETFNDLGKASLKFDKISKKQYRVVNISVVTAVAVKLSLVNKQNGAHILPAYFSDGYFNLLPGESKMVTVTSPLHQQGRLSAEGYNL